MEGNHRNIIIAGDGKVGLTLARQLSAEGHDPTLIDLDHLVLEQTMEQYDGMGVSGNCATMSTLEQAGVRVNGKTVNEAVLESTNAYLAAYVLTIVLSTLVVSLDNFSILTNLSGVLACFNNIGPGLELVGPSCNFAGFSTLSKLVLCGNMLAGRLEIFPCWSCCPEAPGSSGKTKLLWNVSG
ncbi:MAG: potassium transporter TrkG [Firmicutes bacterium]|nr:potassium transporter TrkG [Bacillota bacterium]